MSKDTSTGSVQRLRLKEALDNAEANILFLAGLPDKELAKRLDLVHIQSELAEQKRNTDSLQLLEVWRGQLIEARIYKAENNIANEPNDIEIAIADIETVVAKTEARKGGLTNFKKSIKQVRHKFQQGEDDNQFLLFNTD